MNYLILLSEHTHLFSEDEIHNYMVYGAHHALIYVFCLIGTIVRDLIAASKSNTKINLSDFLTNLVYALSCSMLISMIWDIVHFDVAVSVRVFVCFLSGVWSREVVSIILNNRVIMFVLKNIAKILIDKTGTAGATEGDELQEIFQNAIESGRRDDQSDSEYVIEDDPSGMVSSDDDIGGLPPEEDIIEENPPPEEDTLPEEEEEYVEEGISSDEDDDSDEISESPEDPVGEFEWVEILEK